MALLRCFKGLLNSTMALPWIFPDLGYGWGVAVDGRYGQSMRATRQSDYLNSWPPKQR